MSTLYEFRGTFWTNRVGHGLPFFPNIDRFLCSPHQGNIQANLPIQRRQSTDSFTIQTLVKGGAPQTSPSTAIYVIEDETPMTSFRSQMRRPFADMFDGIRRQWAIVKHQFPP